MRFTMPKPLHGWREFGGEIAVIMIGVLLALAAQELLSNFDWGRRVEAGEASLRDEATDHSKYFAEQLAVGPCIVAQIDELEKKVIAPGPLKDVYVYRTWGPQVIRSPSRTYSRENWNALIADETLAHLQPQRRLASANYYSQLQSIIDDLPQTATLQQRLGVLANPISLDSQSRIVFLADLAQLRDRTILQTLVATHLLGQLRDLGRLPQAAVINEAVAQSEKDGTVAACKKRQFPLGDWRAILTAEPVKKLPGR